MTKDSLFSRPRKTVPPFEFNASVAEVFDDMLNRSVPCYRELIQRQAQLTARFHRPGTRIYDLGCSTGNLGLAICSAMQDDSSFELVGVDNSEAMLKVYRERLPSVPGATQIRLACSDIRELTMNNASVVILNLTLQFIPPTDRETLLEKIYRALVPGGVLLLTEKTVHAHAGLSELQQDFYYRLKAENGYSEMEISQKREALENVLIPETVETHLKRLRRIGFNAVDIWLKWFNFTAFIALKETA